MLRIRPMTAAEIAVGMRLKLQAKWNQTEADWQRLLAMDPGGLFYADHDGESVGTIATTLFGSVAWISMVLVDESMRGKGIGTELLTHALNYLDGRGVPSVRLDATPMGQPLYEKLGFVAEYQVLRYEGVLPDKLPVDGGIAYAPQYHDALISLDRAVTGTDRAKLLYRLINEPEVDVEVFARGGAVAGFLSSRPGTRARQIGPCIADAAAGQALLAEAFHRYAGQLVFIDIPAINTAATALADAHGLTVQRPFLRMVRGTAVTDYPQQIWASFGPEKG